MASKRLLAELGAPSPPSPTGAGVRSPPPSSRLSFSASAEASGAARFSQGRYPPTLTMVTEAVGALNERKGSSTAAIKRYIRHNYPGVDPIRLKYYLRRALLKGLEKGYLVRPLNSSAQGATGRFKVREPPPPRTRLRVEGLHWQEGSAEGAGRLQGPTVPLPLFSLGPGSRPLKPTGGVGDRLIALWADAKGKEKAASKEAKMESDSVLAAGPTKPKPKPKPKPKEKTAAEGKAPKKPRVPKTVQVKLAKPPAKVPPKGEAKTAAKGKARPKTGPPKTGPPKTGAPKAGKRAAAKGKEKEAKGAAGPEDT
ncbi:protein B4 [Pseudonaja textilis]|uniref:protein B4 n=1 Tax=Pseudonaja textilis TaxID=8673 RepID=UPI000EA9003E|nr:protein B4 [Pseudonaja textilis]